MPAYRRLTAVTLLLAFPTLAFALDGTRTALAPPPPAVGTGSIVQIVFSLLLVLAAIVLIGWLLKRMNLAPQGNAGHLKIVDGMAIGQRERIVLVEVGNTWLLIGVAPGQIRTLHTIEKPEDAAGLLSHTNTAKPIDTKFAAMLASIMSKRPNKDSPDAR